MQYFIRDDNETLPQIKRNQSFNRENKSYKKRKTNSTRNKNKLLSSNKDQKRKKI